MAGELLRSKRTPQDKSRILLLASVACFAVAVAVDTTIWPIQTRLNYTLAPVVKRIWTPSWAVFSAGWTFMILAAFYWVVDVRGFRRLAFPLAIVGMNSIAVYVMAELIRGWLGSMLKIHLATLDAAWGTRIVHAIYETELAHIWVRLGELALIWLICLWMYRRRLFVRI
jgi:predicted acyltransferase